MRRHRARAIVLAAAIAIMPSLSMPPVLAACHFFSVAVDPATVAEGGGVTVTVSRDGGVGSSSVQVTTRDIEAKGGKDYTPVDRTVSFSQGEIEQAFVVSTTEDALDEAAERFRVDIHDSQGSLTCTSPTSEGPDATVTIADDDDPEPSPTPSKTASQSPRPSKSATTSPSPTTTASPTVIRSRSQPGSPAPTASGLASADDGASDGLSGGVVGAIVAGAIAVGIATLVLTRRRAST